MMSKIKRKKAYTSILDRFQRDETFHESHLAHGWTEAWCKYLDRIANIDISHQASSEQRARYPELYHFRYASDNLGPMKARSDYYMATRAIESMNNEAGQKPQITSKTSKTRDLDPQKREWLIWLSQNLETYVADDRHTVSWSSTQWYHRSKDKPEHLGNRCRQVPLNIGGRIPGGATQHGVMTTNGNRIRTRTRSAEVLQ